MEKYSSLFALKQFKLFSIYFFYWLATLDNASRWKNQSSIFERFSLIYVKSDQSVSVLLDKRSVIFLPRCPYLSQSATKENIFLQIFQ